MLREQAGATAVEYAIMAGFIAVAIAAAVQTIGAKLVSIFNTAAGWPW